MWTWDRIEHRAERRASYQAGTTRLMAIEVSLEQGTLLRTTDECIVALCVTG